MKLIMMRTLVFKFEQTWDLDKCSLRKRFRICAFSDVISFLMSKKGSEVSRILSTQNYLLRQFFKGSLALFYCLIVLGPFLLCKHFFITCPTHAFNRTWYVLLFVIAGNIYIVNSLLKMTLKWWFFVVSFDKINF